jgi:hypothetical protein
MTKKPTSHRRDRLDQPRGSVARPNRIAEFSRKRGLTYDEIAKKIRAIANARGLAKYCNVHEQTIGGLARGTQALTPLWMELLAEALDVRSPLQILDRIPGENLRHVEISCALRGNHFAQDHAIAKPDEIMVPDSPIYRGLPLYGGIVIGEMMNLEYPDGSTVVMSKLMQLPGEIMVGEDYHVRRRRVDGATEETLKRLVADSAGKYWLRPLSDHPEHQTWVELAPAPSDGITVELVGRVVASWVVKHPPHKLGAS